MTTSLMITFVKKRQSAPGPIQVVEESNREGGKRQVLMWGDTKCSALEEIGDRKGRSIEEAYEWFRAVVDPWIRLWFFISFSSFYHAVTYTETQRGGIVTG